MLALEVDFGDRVERGQGREEDEDKGQERSVEEPADPGHDEDLGSFMSPSLNNSSGSLDPSLRTPDSSFRSTGKIRRGRRPKSPKRNNLPIKLPDLDSPT